MLTENVVALRILRQRLTLLSALLTGAVLLVTGFFTLSVAERQLQQSGEAVFQSNVNAIIAKLRTDRVVSFTWLAQTEATEGLVIDLRDGGRALSFPGAWTPSTPRATLIARAEAEGRRRGVDVTLPPLSVIETSGTMFEIHGDAGERYLATVTLLPGSGSWQSLILLRNMSASDRQVWSLRVAFIILTVLGVVALVLLCWYFSGRAIRPIEESRRKQAEFIAAASHELRSPLAVIRTSAEAVAIAPTTAPLLLGTINRECIRMGRLIEDLLALARSDAGTWTMTWATVDLDTLLLETSDGFYVIARERNLSLHLKVPEVALPTVTGDVQRLRQILTILLDNAFSYTPAGGAVTLEGLVQGHWVLLRVTDTGHGIPPQHLPHIFERFYRADQSRTEKEHFGLGLSIAIELALLHGGSISVAETSHKGTVFELRLPLLVNE